MIARQPAETQGIIRVLLAHIAPLDRRIGVLEMELAVLRVTPRNSSLPPAASLRLQSRIRRGRNGADKRCQ